MDQLSREELIALVGELQRQNTQFICRGTDNATARATTFSEFPGPVAPLEIV